MDLPLPPDFKEFLGLLASAKIEYLIVGGYAVSYHGYPRPTGDLDVWVDMNVATATKLVDALATFGFGNAGATKELFLTPGRVVRMGVPPVRIEVLNSITGVAFADCYLRKTTADLDGVSVTLISRDDLIANKTAADRDKDRNDVKHLRG